MELFSISKLHGFKTDDGTTLSDNLLWFHFSDSGVRADQQKVHVRRGQTGVQTIRGQSAEKRSNAGSSVGNYIAKLSRVSDSLIGCDRSRTNRHHHQSHLHPMWVSKINKHFNWTVKITVLFVLFGHNYLELSGLITNILTAVIKQLSNNFYNFIITFFVFSVKPCTTNYYLPSDKQDSNILKLIKLTVFLTFFLIFDF